MDFKIGVGVPLWRKAQKSTIQASEIETKVIEQQALNYQLSLSARKEQLLAQLSKYEKAVSFYQQEGSLLAREIINTATKAFKNGEIDFLQYLQSMENAKTIEKSYLDNLFQYNSTVLEINYLMN